MKRFNLFKSRVILIILLFLFNTTVFSQTTNDFRSVQTGNWNNSTTWERYDGSSWVALSAFPVVGSTNSSAQATASTTHVVNLPSGIQNGDLLLIFWVDASTVNTNPTIPSGWTEISNSDVGNRYRAVWYKVADGTEGATINITGGNEKSAHNTYRIESGTYSGVPSISAVSSANTNAPNPPNHTSGFGVVNTLWIASAHSAGDGSTITNPTNYTNQVSGYSGTAGDADSRMVSARRSLSAASENPGSFTGYSANRQSAAYTVAIQPMFPTSTSNVITVRNTHTVTVTTNVSADQVTVDAGGQVTINTGQTLTIANGTGTDLTVDGTIVNSGTITTTGTVAFNATGIYEHARDAGSIPTATWNVASNCNVTGVTGTAPTNVGQPFGNFTWSCAGQTTGAYLVEALTTINGNFTVDNTSTSIYGLYLAETNNSTYTLNIGGNLNINNNAWLAMVYGQGNNAFGDNVVATVNVGGNFSMTGFDSYFDYWSSFATGGGLSLNKLILNVAGDFSIADGLFNFTGGNSDVANFTELRIGGNYSLTGAGLMTTSTGDNQITNGTITFNKAGTQTLFSAAPANLELTNFIVASGSTLQLLSNIELSSSATAVWGGNFTVNNGGVLNSGTNQLLSSTGTGAGNNNSFTLNSGAGLITANVNGVQNANIGTVSTSLAARTYSSAANYTFNGTAIQNSGTFTTSPTANEVNNLTVNNTAGVTTTGVTLQQAFAVAGTLTLTSGHFTTTSNLLTMKAGSGVAGQNYASRISGGTNNSFVNGPMRKVGNTNFLFPIGKVNGGERYCGISAPANPTDAFDAEFIRGNATALGAVTSSGLNHVSFCEYWDIDRTTGSSNVNVTLSWSGSSPCNAAVYVNDLATLVVAHFGTTWDAHGNDGGNTGNVSAGSVTWNNVATFSPFSLGSTDEATNPLPVKFTAIKAYPVGNRNKIEWTNLTETAIDKYEIERSTDGISFAAINSVNARTNAGGKEEYDAFDDNIAFATIWYRIKAKNIDGSSIYSAVVKVNRADKDDTKLLVYPNPVVGKQLTLQFYSSRNENYTVRIFSNSGQQVYSTNWNHAGGSASRSIELPASLSSGYYHLQVTGSDKTLTSKFVIQ